MVYWFTQLRNNRRGGNGLEGYCRLYDVCDSCTLMNNFAPSEEYAVKTLACSAYSCSETSVLLCSHWSPAPSHTSFKSKRISVDLPTIYSVNLLLLPKIIILSFQIIKSHYCLTRMILALSWRSRNIFHSYLHSLEEHRKVFSLCFTVFNIWSGR